MQDRPTAAELVEAVHEFLTRDVMPAVDGRLAFHTRVALNVLAMVQRELAVGAVQDTEQRARLVAVLGHDGDSTKSLEQELAAAIRSGAIDPAANSAALDHIRASVREKLEVANPKYLDQ